MAVGASMLLTVLALVLFALGIARHHRQAFGRPPSRPGAIILRTAGALTLAAAPAPWALDQGLAIGVVTWLWCGLPLAGLVVVALFTWVVGRPKEPS